MKNESLILAYSWSSGHLFVNIFKRKEHWCQIKNSKIVNDTHLFLLIAVSDSPNSLFQGFRGEEVVGKLQDDFLPYLSIGG